MANRRGSAEAIEKRRVARQLNTLFGGKKPALLDGRTARRRLRLFQELKTGRNGRPLKAVEVLTRAQELLELGETLTDIRKSGVAAPKIALDSTGMKVVARMQATYGFRPEAWQLLGVKVAR